MKKLLLCLILGPWIVWAQQGETDHLRIEEAPTFCVIGNRLADSPNLAGNQAYLEIGGVEFDASGNKTRSGMLTLLDSYAKDLGIPHGTKRPVPCDVQESGAINCDLSPADDDSFAQLNVFQTEKVEEGVRRRYVYRDETASLQGKPRHMVCQITLGDPEN